MALDATGSPTPLGIPKYDPSNDAPSGLGFNAAMDSLDALIDARIEKPASPNIGDALVWNGSEWVAGSGAAAASVTPIMLTNPQVSANQGNTFWTVTGLTVWDSGHWEFVKDVVGEVVGIVMIPTGVTSANIRIVLAANATSGVTRMGLKTAAVADGESLNPATVDSAAEQDVSVPATAYLRKDVVYAVPSTIAAGDFLVVKIWHNGTHTNDTLAVNTLLFGAWLEPS